MGSLDRKRIDLGDVMEVEDGKNGKTREAGLVHAVRKRLLLFAFMRKAHVIFVTVQDPECHDLGS